MEDEFQFLRGRCTNCGLFGSLFDEEVFPDSETTDKARVCVGGRAVYLFDGGKGPLEDGACSKCGPAYATRKNDEKGRCFYVIKHDEKMVKKKVERWAEKKEAEKEAEKKKAEEEAKKKAKKKAKKAKKAKKKAKKKANNLKRGRDDKAEEAPVQKRCCNEDPVYELLRTYTKLEEDIKKNGQKCCGTTKGGSQRCTSRLKFLPNKWVAGSFFCGKHQKQSPEVPPRCSEQHCGSPHYCKLCQIYKHYMADGAGPRSM